MAHDRRRLAGELGRIGIWTVALRGTDPATHRDVAEAAAELDRLGYGTLWLGGSPSVADAEALLAATSRITVATGILSIWEHPAADVAAAYAAAAAAHRDRLVLGLGVSHRALAGDRYQRPYSAMRRYLTELDEASTPVPADRRVLAALGPRMLELARDRAGGAHPYLVTAEHTALARESLGADAALAPELKVVLDDDPARARATARGYLHGYLQLPNYTNNLRRLGFTDDDFPGGGSDRLLDAVFALGDAEAVRRRVADFVDAGADHVALQVVTDDPRHDLPLPAWRTLAETLPLR
jgi:probable F420-dependent oxidoreductase